MKKTMKFALVLTLAVFLLAGCGLSPATSAGGVLMGVATASAEGLTSEETAGTVTERDASGEYDADGAVTLSPDDDLTITEAGVYILSGTYENKMITVEVGKEDKVQLVLYNAVLRNSDGPAIYVRSADKVFLTAADGTVNSISDGTDYSLTEGETTLDAAVFSKDDLTINGAGELTITGNYKHAVVSKDDLVVTAKNLSISAVKAGLNGKESVTLSEAGVSITAGSDGIRSDEIVSVSGNSVEIDASEGIEATYVLLSGGEITIRASDDGINATQKSTAYTPAVEITGGTITVTMGAGDTDGIDSNGNIIITGGIVSVNGNSTFDYDGTATFTGGTVYVNGQQVTTLPNQMMGGGMGGFGGGPGSFSGEPGGQGGFRGGHGGHGDFGGWPGGQNGFEGGPDGQASPDGSSPADHM